MAYLESGQPKSALSSLLGEALGQLKQGQGASQALLNYSTLASALQLTKYREYFLRQRINLDGIHFQECRFDECILYTETGDIHLKDCVIGPGTSLQLGSTLVSVAKLLTLFSNFPPHWLPTIKPVGNNIYTVSVP